MNVLEDLIAPAVMSDLVSRLISFLIDRYVRRTCSWEEPASRLELLALKIHAVVDEAEQRQIADRRRLLLWLKKLMEGMYRAYYVVDAARHRRQVDDHQDGRVLLSRRPSKRLRTVAAGDDNDDDRAVQLSAVLASLECAAADLQDLIQLLACCPMIPRQRRRAADFRSNDKYMFGRLIEREKIISFLTHVETDLGILPVIGGPEVGKGTIVKHVCDDDRVRSHFDVILYSYGSLLEANTDQQDVLATLRSGGHVLHQEPAVSGRHGRHLLVIKNTYDVVISEAAWTTLCTYLRHSTARGSKIVIVSENGRVAELGTVDSLRVKPLPREEYWYFFRSIALDGNDFPEENRRDLAVLGRQITAALHGSFFAAKVLGRLLRSNLNARFWCSVLHVVYGFQAMMQCEKHFSKLGIAKMVLKVLPVPLKIKCASQSCGPSEFPPGIAIQELLHAGRVPTSEKEMQVVLWESACPPNYRYTVVCEKIQKDPCGATQRRIPGRGRTKSVGN